MGDFAGSPRCLERRSARSTDSVDLCLLLDWSNSWDNLFWKFLMCVVSEFRVESSSCINKGESGGTQ